MGHALGEDSLPSVVPDDDTTRKRLLQTEVIDKITDQVSEKVGGLRKVG